MSTSITIPVKGPHGQMFPVILDSDLAPFFNPNKWNVFGNPQRGFYCRAYRRPGNKSKGEPNSIMVLLHRAINCTPKGQLTDHINGNGLDNRRENLRNCNRLQNNFNNGVRKDSTSRFRGVTKRSDWNPSWKCWTAKISVMGKRIHLGYFSTKEEAARAYNEAAKKYHGEFARLNPI